MDPFTSISAMMSRLGPYHLAAVILGLALCAAFIIADFFLLLRFIFAQSHASSTDKERKPSPFAKLKKIHANAILLVGLLASIPYFITSSYGSAAMDTVKDKGSEFFTKVLGRTTQNTSIATSTSPPFLGLAQYLNVSMLPSESSLNGKRTDHILSTSHFGLVNSSDKQIINTIRHDDLFSVIHNDSRSSSSSLFLNNGSSNILMRNDTYNVSVSLNISGFLDILLNHTDSDEMVPIIESIFTRAIEANHYIIGSACYTPTVQMVDSVNSTLTDAEAIFAQAKDEIHDLVDYLKDQNKKTCPVCPASSMDGSSVIGGSSDSLPHRLWASLNSFLSEQELKLCSIMIFASYTLKGAKPNAANILLFSAVYRLSRVGYEMSLSFYASSFCVVIVPLLISFKVLTYRGFFRL